MLISLRFSENFKRLEILLNFDKADDNLQLFPVVLKGDEMNFGDGPEIEEF